MPFPLISTDDLAALEAVLLAIRERNDGQPPSQKNRPFTQASLKRLALQYGKHSGVSGAAVERVMTMPLAAMLSLD